MTIDNFLAKNIKFLRKQNNETLEELGDKIGVKSNTIWNYEKGIREPSNDILTSLSEYYFVSVNDLLYKDLSQYIYGTLPNNSDEIYNFLRIMFPYKCSEKALLNTNFKRAYKNTVEIFESLKNPTNVLTSTFIEKTIEKYEISFQEDETLFESVVNILCLIFMYYSIGVGQNEKQLKMGLALYNGEGDDKNFRKKYYTGIQNSGDKEVEIFKKNFIANVDSQIYEIISILKATRYSDIADYYIALKYILDFIDDENESLFNMQVGYQFMYTYVRIGNVYARKFHEAIFKNDE